MKFQDVYEYFCSFTPIPVEEWEKLEALFKIRRVDKGHILLQEGQDADTFYFVYSGLLRIYHLVEDKKEFTKVYKPKFSIAAAYPDILNSQSSRLNISTLEDSLVFALNYRDFEKLCEGNICWLKLNLALLKQHYLLKERREYELLVFDAKDRYEVFIKEYEDIMDKIPQYQIASYLGVTSVSLSRLLRKK